MLPTTNLTEQIQSDLKNDFENDYENESNRKQTIFSPASQLEWLIGVEQSHLWYALAYHRGVILAHWYSKLDSVWLRTFSLFICYLVRGVSYLVRESGITAGVVDRG